jgi:hypothetical protein
MARSGPPPSPPRATTNVTLPEKIEEVLRLEALASERDWFTDDEARFTEAARNIIRPLAQGYTAALTALEASDSDRKRLKARVAELEAELAKEQRDG